MLSCAAGGSNKERETPREKTWDSVKILFLPVILQSEFCHTIRAHPSVPADSCIFSPSVGVNRLKRVFMADAFKLTVGKIPKKQYFFIYKAKSFL